MPTKHFRCKKTEDGPWFEGCTVQFWDFFVRRFFETFPNGELVWTHDTMD